MVRLVAQPKLVNGKLFNQGVCNFSYGWKSRNEDILLLESNFVNPLGNIGHEGCSGSENSGDGECGAAIGSSFYAANATGLKAGTAEIQITVTLKYGRSQAPVTKFNVIKAKVEDPIWTNLPTYVNGPEGRSDLLLIPLDSKYKIESNRSIGYKYSLAYSSLRKNLNTCGTGVVSDADFDKFSDVVDISHDGTLQTNNQRGRATLLVEDLYKNSEFQMINLLVTPVYSVFVHNSYKASILPLQSVTKLRVMYQDEAGRLFPERLEGGDRILVQSSDPSVLEVDLGDNSDFLVVRAKKLGTSIVVVSLSENPSVYDVFYLLFKQNRHSQSLLAQLCSRPARSTCTSVVLSTSPRPMSSRTIPRKNGSAMMIRSLR